MRDDIIKLRKEGKTYSEISKILGCSKSTVSYHCGKGQKEKSKIRQNKRRFKNRLIKKVDYFKSREDKHRMLNRVNAFTKKSKYGRDHNLKPSFNYKDVIDKFGVETKCYLTGENINLLHGKYELDHIIPVTRGGDNSLGNLGILAKEVNQAKRNLTNEEFFELCKRVLEYNGYTVN